MAKKNIKEAMRTWMAEQKESYKKEIEREKTSIDLAAKEAGEKAYKFFSGAYSVSYLAGYAYESASATKVGYYLSSIGQSAKKGFSDGRGAKVDHDIERLTRACDIMSGDVF